MLDRLRRDVWNWLPAFLEVADAGTVSAAARRLNLTAAAVSRTLGLLEAAHGAPLFARVGRNLVLNASGRALRDAVRAATHAVDAGLSESLGDPFQGPLRVASIGVLTEHYVLPALLSLKSEHAAIIPEHANLGPAEAIDLLVRGLLDVAFYYEELTAEPLVVERLGQIGASIYCGRGHPLFHARRPTLADLERHPFSVPQVGASGRVQDGWPPDRPRTIGMRITMLRSNLTVSLSGALLTVLPDVTAAAHVAAGELRRLPPLVDLAPIGVFAARHASAAERRPAQRVIEHVRTALTAGPNPPPAKRKRRAT